MYRPRSTALVLLTLTIAAAASLTGCSTSQEEQLISNFFSASRMRDNTTLANIAMVSFSPMERGVVRNFSVESIGEEQRRAMQARSFSETLQEAEGTENEFFDRKQAYQDENIEAIERVLEAEREGNEPGRRDGEVQEAWTQWREEMAEHAQRVSDARAGLAEERVVAEASTFNPQLEIDVTQYGGEIASKDVRIMATVQTPDDQEVEQSFLVTMERAELTGQDGSPLTGRWVITRLDEG